MPTLLEFFRRSLEIFWPRDLKIVFYLAPCRVTQCGSGYIGNEFTNFAWYCTNTSVNPICKCKKGFIQDGNRCVEGKLLPA